VTELLLITDDDDEYLVDMDATGSKLLDHLDAYVEVGGLARNEDGELFLTVQRFKQLEEAPDDDDE
jgi:hypothetical protein